MKTEKEIERTLSRVDSNESNFRGMTYEQGVEEALQWVLEEIGDSEFQFAE